MVTVRQIGSSAAVLAAGAVLAMTMAACNGGNQASGGTTTTSSGAAPTQAGPGATAPAAPASTQGGSCRKADLSAALGTKKEVPVDVQGELGDAGMHYSIPLVWTNISSTTCTMDGYGGVDLDGPDKGSAGGPKYSLPRTSDTPTKVTLRPGDKAHTVIQYIDPSTSAPASTPEWTPTRLEVTAPNDTEQLQVNWTAGTPVDQDTQSGPAAANISPVTAGAGS